jgi:hypothetical protein
MPIVPVQHFDSMRIQFKTESSWSNDESREKSSDTALLNDTTALGDGVLDVHLSEGTTWVLRQQNLKGAFGDYALVALDKEYQPVATLTSTVRPKFIVDTSSMDSKSISGQDLWLVIPEHGLMHLHLSQSQY